MECIFITGTAGSGKSLLTSKLFDLYEDNGKLATIVNLDPGSTSTPYSPEVDIRNYIDLNEIMDNYQLGPNGALLMACDLIATKLQDIENEIFELNPDIIIVDTPGQIELFAFRASGPYIIRNLNVESKVCLFVFDGVLAASPINYVSINLLAASVNLRLNLPQINVMTKRDMIIDRLNDIIKWSSSITLLERYLEIEKNTEYSNLSKRLGRVLSNTGLMQNPIIVSSVTMSGMINLSAALSRILSQGEEK